MKFASKWRRVVGPFRGWAALVCLSVRLAHAGEVPLSALQDQTRADEPLGRFELMAWSPRDKFPDLGETVELVAGEPKKDGAVWVPPATIRANIVVTPSALIFHTNGRADKSEAYNWAPFLAFEPKEPGIYALSGTLSLTSGNKESEDRPIQWAVWVAGMRKIDVICEGQGNGGDMVDLAAQPTLRAVKLGKGEQIGLSAWRRTWHWNGGARLTDFAIEKVR